MKIIQVVSVVRCWGSKYWDLQRQVQTDGIFLECVGVAWVGRSEWFCEMVWMVEMGVRPVGTSLGSHCWCPEHMDQWHGQCSRGNVYRQTYLFLTYLFILTHYQGSILNYNNNFKFYIILDANLWYWEMFKWVWKTATRFYFLFQIVYSTTLLSWILMWWTLQWIWNILLGSD